MAARCWEAAVKLPGALGERGSKGNATAGQGGLTGGAPHAAGEPSRSPCALCGAGSGGARTPGQASHRLALPAGPCVAAAPDLFATAVCVRGAPPRCRGRRADGAVFYGGCCGRRRALGGSSCGRRRPSCQVGRQRLSRGCTTVAAGRGAVCAQTAKSAATLRGKDTPPRRHGPAMRQAGFPLAQINIPPAAATPGGSSMIHHPACPVHWCLDRLPVRNGLTADGEDRAVPERVTAERISRELHQEADGDREDLAARVSSERGAGRSKTWGGWEGGSEGSGA